MRSAVLLISALVLAAVPAAASTRASGADYLKFLQALEGDWQGQGNATSYDGTGMAGSFDFQMALYREGNTTTWLANTGRSSSSGASTRDGISFYLAGENLLIDHDSIQGGFSSISESTDHSIDYVVSETDGTVFVDHYYHWDVSGTGLEGSIKIERDGQETYEESFSATKSQRH
jgi:hypothetical protein